MNAALDPAATTHATATATTPPPAARWLRRAWATLLVLAVCGGVTTACHVGQTTQLAPHMTFALDSIERSPYTVLTNGFYNPRPEMLVVWALGILIFGLMVERNAGATRTLLVAATGAAGGVGGWWLFNTPTGLEYAHREVYRIFFWLFEYRGPEAAGMFLDGWNVALRHLTWSAPVFGAAGVCGALLGYAALRRSLHSDDLTVRPVKFVLAAVFLAAAAYSWPHLIDSAFPYAMLVGGIAAGAALIVPEKAIRFVWERYREHAR